MSDNTKPEIESMTREELIAMIRSMQSAYPSLASYAESIGCSASTVSDIYHGHRDPGPSVLKALGVEKQITYKRWK